MRAESAIERAALSNIDKSLGEVVVTVVFLAAEDRLRRNFRQRNLELWNQLLNTGERQRFVAAGGNHRRFQHGGRAEWL